VNGPRWHAGDPLRGPSSDGAGYMSSGLLSAEISEDAAAALLASSGRTLAQAQDSIEASAQPRSFALAESATVTVNLRRTRATTRNVVGCFRAATARARW